MNRNWILWTIVACLFGALFYEVLFFDRNFIYRDAGHFYYPIYQHIRNRVLHGEVPLWNSQETGGVPLLANPTSGVLYPLSAILLLPNYGVAFKAFHLLHLVIAVIGSYWAARRFEVSRPSSILTALSYSFSSFVVFQIYNVIFLIGAAWLPFAMVAVDRIVRAPSWLAALGLAFVLSMQTFAGDPQAAYIVLLLAIPYAVFFHLGWRDGWRAMICLLCLGFLITNASRLLNDVQTIFKETASVSRRPLGAEIRLGIAILAVLILGLWFSARRTTIAFLKVTGRRSVIMLGGTAALLLLLTAAQVLPTLEFVARSDRAAPDAPDSSVGFSFFPARVIELVVPTFFGKQLPLNTRWAPFAPIETPVWIPSFYQGLAPLLLAFFAMRFRKTDLRTMFLTWLVLLSFWAAIGKFGGPYWLLSERQRVPSLGGINPIDPEHSHGYEDGLFGILIWTAPGFRSFRYPSKLLVFTVWGIAMLAGIGLDRLLQEKDSRAFRYAKWIVLVTGILLAVTLSFGTSLIHWLAGVHVEQGGVFGPVVVPQAARELCLNLLQALVAAVFLWILSRWGLTTTDVSDRPKQSIAIALCGMLAVDLYLANRWQIFTDSQSSIDASSPIAKAIADAEKKDPSPQPFRIHRMPTFHPVHWFLNGSEKRMVELSRWERMTLQPKYMLKYGLNFCQVIGTMDLYDPEFFFAPFPLTLPREIAAKYKQLAKDNAQVVYYPRTGFDLWASRYFLMSNKLVLNNEDRGTLMFRVAQNVEPCPEIISSPPDADDFLLVRNPDAFDRARIVHQADLREPIVGLDRAPRRPVMEQLLYGQIDLEMGIWKSSLYGPYPHKNVAMIESRDVAHIQQFHSGAPKLPSETVSFERDDPERVTMRAKLEAPGFLLLADANYPGWAATVDGKPAPILLANRAMRAVGLPAGEHVVEMRYRCLPFEIGAWISAIAWIGAILAFFVLRRRALPTKFPSSIEMGQSSTS